MSLGKVSLYFSKTSIEADPIDPESECHKEAPMSILYYIGLDNHKKTIAYGIKKIDGTLVRQGSADIQREMVPPGTSFRRNGKSSFSP